MTHVRGNLQHLCCASGRELFQLLITKTPGMIDGLWPSPECLLRVVEGRTQNPGSMPETVSGGP